MRVWDKAGTYQPEKASVSTWLLRIARNRALDVLRSRSGRKPLPWDLTPEDESDPADVFGGGRSSGRSSAPWSR